MINRKQQRNLYFKVNKSAYKINFQNSFQGKKMIDNA